MQPVQDSVGGRQRENPFALQDIVDVGLGYAGHPGQAALGDLAVANAFAKVRVETPLELSKIHHAPARAYFLQK